MTIVQLRISFTGPEYYELFERLLNYPLLPEKEISNISVDSKSLDEIEQWINNPIKRFKHSIFVRYEGREFLSMGKGIVKLVINQYHLNPQALLQEIAKFNFELISFDSFHEEWFKQYKYEGPGFADRHWPHGWACAFQGEGHSRLVSRRWLDYGPWRVLSGNNNDTTLIQFHDLAADADTALAQARIGHERMGISDTGGFISKRHPLTYDIDGIYEPQEKKLKVIVLGREVSQTEMCDACAVKINNRLGPEQPLDSVAYVFMEEHAAHAHLHELWLRELECWVIIDGKEVRLDLDYHPTPKKQDWVKAVEARETNEE